MEPTVSARAIRLEAIRRRAADTSDTSEAALDRRWLLGEIDRLERDLTNTRERLTAIVADYERDTR